MNVEVTRHALDRWRQRVARYGDAGVSEVLEAFDRSEKCHPPFVERPNRMYYRWGNCFFVAAPVDAKQIVLVTVLGPDEIRSQRIVEAKTPRRRKHEKDPRTCGVELDSDRGDVRRRRQGDRPPADDGRRPNSAWLRWYWDLCDDLHEGGLR